MTRRKGTAPGHRKFFRGARTFLLGAIGVVLGLHGPAVFADQYRVTVSDLPSFDMDDSVSYSSNLRLDTDFLPPVADLGIVPPVAGTGTGGSSIPLPTPDPSGFRVSPPDTTAPERPQTNLDGFLDPNTPPPSQAFINMMRGLFLLTDPAIVAGVWKYCLAENPALTLREKVPNAVLAYSWATGIPLSDGSFVRMNSFATRGTVDSFSGLGVREIPWGSRRVSIGNGTVVNMIPPMEDGWYHIASPEGWIIGLWVIPQ